MAWDKGSHRVAELWACAWVDICSRDAPSCAWRCKAKMVGDEDQGRRWELNLPQTFGLVDKRTFLLLGEQFPFGTCESEREKTQDTCSEIFNVKSR